MNNIIKLKLVNSIFPAKSPIVNKPTNNPQIILNFGISAIKLKETKGRIENKPSNRATKIFKLTPVIILFTNKQQVETARANRIVNFIYFFNSSFITFKASKEKYENNATGIETAIF